MNILLVLEGNEEEALFDIARNNGFHESMNVHIINAEGSGRVAPFFQDAISNGYYDVVMCVYDVDNRISDFKSPFNEIRKKLLNILGTEEKVDAISICWNPNILQYFLLAADKLENVKLLETSKKENTEILRKYWPKLGNKKEYDGSGWQLDILKNSIIFSPYSYDALLKNAEELSENYKSDIPSGNLLGLLIALKEGKKSYFKKAINVIGSKGDN